MTAPKPSIFISYGRKDDHDDYHDADKSFLRKLYTDLTTDDYTVWWDRESMPSRGLTFLQEIQDAVTTHDKLLLIVGPYGMQSQYVQAEWEYAQRICKPIIPILLKGDYNLLPESMANYHAPDFRESRDYLDAILELKRILDEPQPEPAVTYNVPSLPRGYIERDEFVNVRNAVLSDAISPTVTYEEDQIIFIQGSGGIGKSTIASAVGRLCEVRRRYRDGVIWLILGKKPIIAQKQGDVGITFGDSRENYQDPDTGKQNLNRILANKNVLIILDDVWSHKDVQAFMALGARCRMIVTTRDYSIPLMIHGHEHDIEKLTEIEGLNLLGAWQKRDPSTLNPHKKEELEIINLLDGYTLAVALVGAQLARKQSGYNHTEILERLKEGRTFQDLKINEEDKNFNLEKSLYLSYVDLSDADQKRFRQLGILAPNATFDIPLIQAVWEDDEYKAEDALNRLVSAALLEHDESGRWSQHMVLRLYAQGLLNEGERYGAFVCYVEYVTEISQFQDLPMQHWDTQIGPDYPHIDYIGDTLLERYAQQPDTYRELTGDFIWVVPQYIGNRPVLSNTKQGRVWRGLDWLKLGVAIYIELDQKSRQATTLNNIGRIYDSLGDKQQALSHYEQALPILHEAGNRNVEATTLNNIGVVHDDLGDRQQALSYYERALPIRREVGDRSGEAITLNNIGRVYRRLGDNQRALSYYEKALPIRQEVGNRSGEATTLNNIGMVYQALGDNQQTLAYYEQALPIHREVWDRSGEAVTLNNIGGVYRALGDNQQALSYFEQALPTRREAGDQYGEATTCYNMAMIYRDEGDLDRAIEYLEYVIILEEQIQYPDLESDRQFLEQLKHERDAQDDD